MKITIKTLQQKQLNFEVNPEDPIKLLKEKIGTELKVATELQKLIFSGKILADDAATVESCGVKDGDFLVLMVTKPKTVSSAPSAQAGGKSTTAAATNKAAVSGGAENKAEVKAGEQRTPLAKPDAKSQVQPAAPKKDDTTVASQSGATPSQQQSSFSGADALVSGNQYQQAVNNLVEMGFQVEEVKRAMRAAFNNPDRAVEYLMTGIPQQQQQQQDDTVSNAATAGDLNDDDMDYGSSVGGGSVVSGGGQAAGVEGEGTVTSPSPFDELARVPQFEQLRQMILQNPQLLEPMLAQLQSSHPHLLQLIAQDPDAFFTWLANAGGDQNVPEGATVIRLTQEESAAIERLQALGFDRNAAIEAYLACDKNEMLAANYLFDSGNMQ